MRLLPLWVSSHLFFHPLVFSAPCYNTLVDYLCASETLYHCFARYYTNKLLLFFVCFWRKKAHKHVDFISHTGLALTAYFKGILLCSCWGNVWMKHKKKMRKKDGGSLKCDLLHKQHHQDEHRSWKTRKILTIFVLGDVQCQKHIQWINLDSQSGPICGKLHVVMIIVLAVLKAVVVCFWWRLHLTIFIIDRSIENVSNCLSRSPSPHLQFEVI